METSSSSFKPQEDHFASIRRRNKRLIFIFFSLIFLLTLIIGGIIISLIHKHNLQYSKSLNPHAAVREFCSVTYSEFNCIAFLSHSIESTPESTPTQIFKLSLQTAAERLSKIVPMISVSDSNYSILSQSNIRNCSSSLRDSVSQLNNTIRIMVFNPDEETRREMIERITVAIDDLSSCMKALDSVLSTVVDEPAGGKEEASAALYGARAAVYKVRTLVIYSKNFLLNFDEVNFHYASWNIDSSLSWNRIVEDLSTVTLFGSYYFVLVFLFCLLLRNR